MSQTILKNRTGGATHWTKGCLPCVERSCEGSGGPQKSFLLTFLESTSTCHPGVWCGLGGTVSSSAHIFLPPGSCSRQITTRLQKHGQYEPPPHSHFDLLPSHADTAPSSPPLPSMASAPRLHAAGFSVFWGLLPCHSQPRGSGQSRVSWRGHHQHRGVTLSLVQSLQCPVGQGICAFGYR